MSTAVPLTTAPTSFAEVLELSKRADILQWFLSDESLTLYLDDHPADKRTVIEVRCKAKRVELRTIHKYDAKKNAWVGGYCAPQSSAEIASKAGYKAFRAWLADRAQEQVFYPNPSSLSIYRREKK